MNERLREIAVNAQVEHCISHVRLQEFAELIVRECADIAYDTQYNHGRASYETGSCARAIRQHFEVEE